VLVLVLVLAALPTSVAAAQSTAPGAPGESTPWTEADKDGFGTSTTTASKVWHTLDDGRLTEVYYPNLGTPSIHDLEFIVTDGKTFAQRDSDASSRTITQTDPRSLTYRQVITRAGRYRLTKTYVTDPARDALLLDVGFESLDGKNYDVYARLDPALDNGGDDDSGSTFDSSVVATDGRVASALLAMPAFRKLSSGYAGTASDGWKDISSDYDMDFTYGSAPRGNVVQTAQTSLTGKPGGQRLTLALGFSRGSTRDAWGVARSALNGGFAVASSAYAGGWHTYLTGLKPRPASASAIAQDYDVSVMTLAASEDKTYRGGYIASPSMPWVWATPAIENPSGAYHLVWSRDLYQIATALLAAGDSAGAGRALDYLFDRQQKADGCFPQNSTIDGKEHWTNLQLDQVSFPIVLAWQLGRRDATTFGDVKSAVGCILANGPQTQQERWENQGGWSPATIASEIAGLVCAADLARANGDEKSAKAWEKQADEWQAAVDDWTYTTTGPYGSHSYFLRITKDADPNAGTTYNIGDSGPAAVDQRKVVDTSFLELVRLGVKRANDPQILSTLAVTDAQLGVGTPNGVFWHRFNFDGYGEQKDGSPWNFGFPSNPTEDWSNNVTIGRIWPIFAGERGEYELAAGHPGAAAGHLTAVAKAGNDGHMIPEQVWDQFPPSGETGFPRGEATLSASPLAWSHAQLVRLAWSIDAGRPVERPSVVACRYAGCG
jgi:glucoamylase